MRDVIIADLQGITRIGMETLLKNSEGVSSIHLADTKQQLVHLLISKPNALVVLDYSLFDFISVDDLLIVDSRFADCHWILFSEELSTTFLKRLLLCSDSFSIVDKNCQVNEIEACIVSAHRNEHYICAKVTNQLSSAQQATDKNIVLTASEKEILKEIALGKTTKEIAAGRFSSFHTVITHRKNIFRKLEVNNVHEATKYAMRAGIIDPAEYYI